MNTREELTKCNTAHCNLKVEWLDWKQLTVPRDGLLLVMKREDVFNTDINAGRFQVQKTVQQRESLELVHDDLALLISGYTVYNGLCLSDKVSVRGNPTDGNSRTVYEILGPDSGVDIRAGLTVHNSRGSWSSWPPHEFEEMAAHAPIRLWPFFTEYYALLTEPAGLWGAQIHGHGCSGDPLGRMSSLRIFADQEIINVPLVAHPTVAMPGVKLAYVWAYTALEGWEKLR